MSDKDINIDILDRVDRRTGMTVPDGYFDSFAARMKESLPEQDWEREAASETHVMPARSIWQKIRPYVYMAAMFAGIWLMMNVSTLVGTGGEMPASSSSIPTVAQLIEDENEFTDYAVDNFDRMDIYDDLYASGFNPVNLSYSNQ